MIFEVNSLDSRWTVKCYHLLGSGTIKFTASSSLPSLFRTVFHMRKDIQICSVAETWRSQPRIVCSDVLSCLRRQLHDITMQTSVQLCSTVGTILRLYVGRAVWWSVAWLHAPTLIINIHVCSYGNSSWPPCWSSTESCSSTTVLRSLPSTTTFAHVPITIHHSSFAIADFLWAGHLQLLPW